MLTPWTNSTQETAASYLRKYSTDLCIVNSGHHDVNLEEQTDEPHVENVVKYVDAMKRVCKHVIWLSENKVPINKNFNQRNPVIVARINMVETILMTFHPYIGYIDTYPMSTRANMHHDNVHMNATYYQTLAALFLFPFRNISMSEP